MSLGPWTLCNGPETLTQWKSESVIFLPTYLLTRVGSGDGD